MDDWERAGPTPPVASPGAFNPRKIFVGNLAYSVDDRRLAEMFKEFGAIEGAKIVKAR